VTTQRRDMADVEGMIDKGMANRLMGNLEDILVFNNIHLLVNTRPRFQHCTAHYLVHPSLTGSLRLRRMAKSTTTTKERERRLGKSLTGCLKKATQKL
jgi:hypothetical protein